MRRWAPVLAGAAAGAIVGLALLALAEPNAADLNDSYRAGADVGFVARYAVAGLVIGIFLREPARRTSRAYAGVAAVALALIAWPVVDRLDGRSPSEERRAQATDIEDRAAREAADMRAGAIDGCSGSWQQRLEADPDLERFDTDAYCTCLIDRVIETGTGDTATDLEGMATAARGGPGQRRIQRLVNACFTEVTS